MAEMVIKKYQLFCHLCHLCDLTIKPGGKIGLPALNKVEHIIVEAA
jgi:hypothetical protein